MTDNNRKDSPAGAAPDGTMRAVTVPRYGGPEVLHVSRIPRPTPAPGEVLVRVAWGAINAADRRLMRADPWMVRLAFGLRRPRFAALGIAFSGTVVASSVGHLKAGDRVMADLSAVGCGAFAEYVSVPANVLVPVPDGVELDVAATLPLAGTTALQALRDQAQVAPGARVLVTGASGAVGAITVQLAHAMGAEVWAVTSGTHLEMVGSLEPTRVINRDDGDIVARGDLPADGFDAIIDTAGYRNIFDYEPLLTPQGTYVHVGGSMRRLVQTATAGAARSRRGGKRWRTFTASADAGDLSTIAAHAAAGVVAPPIAARFPLEAAADAMRAAEGGTLSGRVLLRME
jgi:NADPH:quinone reductase-like Zn-dependent oxidoreductase